MSVRSRCWLAMLLPLLLAGELTAQRSNAPLIVRRSGSQYAFIDEHNPDLGVLVAVGGIELVQGPRRLLGDTLVLLIDAAASAPAGSADERGQVIPSERVLEVYVEGNVSIEEGDEQISSATAAHVDNRTGVLTLLDGTWRQSLATTPTILRFERMREFVEGRLEVEGATFTTCEYAHAHWGLDTPWMLVDPTPEGRLLKTSFNLGWVGDVPLAPLPAFHMNIDRDRPPLRSVSIGNSSRFGTQIETIWGGDASEMASDVGAFFGADHVDADWNFELSNFKKAGVFFEPSWTYNTGSSFGQVLSSFIHDKRKFDQVDRRIEDRTRGRFDLQHRTRIDEHSVVDAEISYLSDRGFLREYYEGEDRLEKPQETYLNYRHSEDNVAWSVLVRPRLNAFETRVEYLPQVERRVTGEVLDGGPLGELSMTGREFVSEARLLEGEPVEKSKKPPPPAGSLRHGNLRVGSRRGVTWPFELGGDKLTMTVAYDLTAFSRRMRPDATDPSGFRQTEENALRYALLGGASWASTWSGSDPDVHSDLWNLDGVRQIVEPFVDFNSVLEIDHPPSELVVIDDVETLDKLMVFNLGLRHRIQTHQKGRLATVLDTQIDMPVFPNQNRDNAGEDLGFLTIDSKWQPGADIWGLRAASLTLRKTVDPANGFAPVTSVEIYTTRISDKGSISLTHSSATHSNDSVTGGTEWQLTPKWTGALFLQEDLVTHEGIRRGLLLRQRAHRWLIDIELSQRRADSVLTGSSNLEEQITLRFQPAAFADQEETLLGRFARRTRFLP